MLEQAVILVGGKGTRLGSLTATTPKPLLSVGGRPFVEHLLQEISRYGFKKITLLAGTFGEQFKDAFDGRVLFGMNLEVVVEPTPLGTAGALRFAAEQDQLDASFLLMNGDSWIDTDLGDFLRQWQEDRSVNPSIRMQILLHEMRGADRYGLVRVADGLITSFNEKPLDTARATGLINAGIYAVDRSILDGLEPGEFSSLENDLIPRIVDAGQATGSIAAAGCYFIDIGIPESLGRSRKELLQRRRRPALFLDRDGTLNEDHGYTHLPEDLVWLKDAREAVKLANSSGYYVFVVTNQSGVARGYYDEEAVLHFHSVMQRDLLRIGAHIDAFGWCPHHPSARLASYRTSCNCRKPRPGMIEKLCEQWPVDLDNSVLIGNSDSDIAAANAAGIPGFKFNGGSLLEFSKHCLRNG